MVDNKQYQQVHESSWDVVNSVNEASQSFANNLVVMQENNLKFAQNVYLSLMELLTQQSESVQRWQQRGQQSQKSRDAFQRLVTSSTQLYTDFLRTPFSLSRRAIDVTENAVHQER